MGFYDHFILPRLLDLAMRSSRLERYRQRAIAAARGFVLEIGVGSGPGSISPAVVTSTARWTI